MFKILGILFFFLLAVLLLGLGLIASFLMRLFGRGGRTTFHTTRTYRTNYGAQGQNRTDTASPGGQTVEPEEGDIRPSRVKKLFGKEEGEYVDYEEVKD